MDRLEEAAARMEQPAVPVIETYLVRVRRIGGARELWLAGAEPLRWTANRQRALRFHDPPLARRWADWVQLARRDLRADIVWEFAYEASRVARALRAARDG